MNDKIKADRPLPPSLAEFALEQLAEAGEQDDGVVQGCYFESSEAGGYRVSMPGDTGPGSRPAEDAEDEPKIQHHEPLCRLADAKAVIAQRHARIAELEEDLERTSAHRDSLSRTLDRVASELAALKAQPSGVVDERAAQQTAIDTEFPALSYGADQRDIDRQRDRTCYFARGWQARAILNAACAGSGVVLPEPFKMEPYQTVDRGSTNYKAGFNAAIRKVRESLNPCLAQSVPDGYVVVPVKPTPEMLEELTNGDTKKSVLAKLRYKAMLAAAPSAKKEPE